MGGDMNSNSKCSPWVLNSPKLLKDANLTRRRLFSRPDEEPGGAGGGASAVQDSESSTGVVMPPRDPNGLRSSSEASVFDFRDSESESEMPVLERQSLNEMRRVKSKEGDLNQIDADEEYKLWLEMCEDFLIHLQTGKNPKKRGRRKGTIIVGTTVSAVFTTTTTTTTSMMSSSATPPTTEAVATLEEKPEINGDNNTSVKDGSDNNNIIDTSVCDIKKEILSDNESSAVQLPPVSEPVEELVNGVKKEPAEEEDRRSSVVSESEEEAKPPMTLRVRKPKVGPKPRVRKRRIVTAKKKPPIVNGCEFEPGWEKELYDYKRSLRMPSGLITISRQNWPRPPLSLPDIETLPDSPLTADSADTVQPPLVGHAPHKERTLTEEKHYLDRLMARYNARRQANKERQLKAKEQEQVKQDSVSLPPSSTLPGSENTIMRRSGGTGPIGHFKKGNFAEIKDDVIKSGSCTGEADLPSSSMKAKAKADLWPNKENATIREIFGVERPASAPPPGTTNDEVRRKGRKRGSKHLVGKRGLLKGLSLHTGPNAQRQVGEKRLKTIRRKLKSSGFDYIRKKKKSTPSTGIAGPSKKEDGTGDGTQGTRRKTKKTTPKTESEIQGEIKSWVLNKGLGETILHRASRVGNYEVVKYCLDKLQHNPAPRDNAGYTPLHEASSRGNYLIASLLLSHGANVSDSALGGVRPLHEAAENGFYKLVKLLLEHGADPQLATYSGYTPLSLAADEDIRQLISLHITNCNTPPPSVTIKIEDISLSETIQTGEKTDTDTPVREPIDGFEIEESEVPLPHLYRLANESRTDSWVLFHELAPLLHVKTKEALLKQLGQEPQAVLRDMKLADFFAKAHCRTLRAAGASPKMQKVTLVKYTSTVRFLLGVETCIIPR